MYSLYLKGQINFIKRQKTFTCSAIIPVKHVEEGLLRMRRTSELLISYQ